MLNIFENWGRQVFSRQTYLHLNCEMLYHIHVCPEQEPVFAFPFGMILLILEEQLPGKALVSPSQRSPQRSGLASGVCSRGPTAPLGPSTPLCLLWTNFPFNTHSWRGREWRHFPSCERMSCASLTLGFSFSQSETNSLLWWWSSAAWKALVIDRQDAAMEDSTFSLLFSLICPFMPSVLSQQGCWRCLCLALPLMPWGSVRLSDRLSMCAVPSPCWKLPWPHLTLPLTSPLVAWEAMGLCTRDITHLISTQGWKEKY